MKLVTLKVTYDWPACPTELINCVGTRLRTRVIHILSPLQHLTLAGAASSPGHALRVGIRRKMSSNLPACQLARVDFLSIVVETLGWWCPDAITTICSIGQVLGQRLNSTDTADSTKHLFGCLAVALWRSNAALSGCTINRHSPFFWMV